MHRLIGTRIQQALLALAVVGGLALAAPPAPQASVTSCGENNGKECWKNESCVFLLFAKFCTTEYKYYEEK